MYVFLQISLQYSYEAEHINHVLKTLEELPARHKTDLNNTSSFEMTE